jgi:protein-S-isoprenylcysteine O-methyltransferase
MRLNAFELWIHWAGGVAAAVFFGASLWGLWHSLRRPRGRSVGYGDRVLRLPFYFVIGIGFLTVTILLWRPLPLALPAPTRVITLLIGVLLYFPGLALWFWGRYTLGEMFNVSSGFGAQLYADQRLITSGPYAIVRHPMYLGVVMAAWGALLIYQTWATVYIAIAFLGLFLRARREEQALAAEFGADWEAYCRRVPAWIPRFLTSLK